MIKIMRFGEVPPSDVFARVSMPSDVSGAVSAIISDVRSRGDEALLEYTRRFDGAELASVEVAPEEIEKAIGHTGKEFLRVLERAAKNIRKFHACQLRNGFIINDEDGVVMGQKVIPLEKVGLYVPGGTASYPSTVLMDSIPAKIAVFDLEMPSARRDAAELFSRGIGAAVLAGVFAGLTYLLVLLAMNYVKNVSYVQAFRQLGLVIGMLEGILILRERFTLTKIVGITLIVSGLVMTVPTALY